MQILSSAVALWFIFLGLCFIYISTKVNETTNKISFFGCGAFSLFVGVMPFIATDKSSSLRNDYSNAKNLVESVI
jgi:hypothetical protein